MSSKYIKSGLIYTLGNLFVQGLAFITLPLYTRIISPEVFGQYSLYTSWVSLIGLFIGLQTQGSLSIGRIKFKKTYDEYSINMLTVSNIFFLVMFLLVVLFRETFSNMLDMKSSTVIIMLIQSYAMYLLGFLNQYFIQKQKSGITLIFSAISAIFNMVFSILFISNMDNDFLARIYGGIIPVTALGLVTLFYFYSKKNWYFNKEYVKFGLTISLPLIFHHLGHNILNQFDRIMLGKMADLESVARYSFSYSIGLVLQIVLGSINTVWVPFFFEAKKSNHEKLGNYITKYLSLGLFLTLGYLTIFPELVYIMGGKKYESGIAIIPFIILSYFLVFLYTFPVNVQFYYESTKLIPFATLVAGLVNIGLNFIIIPQLGSTGAAITTLVSYIFLLVIHHYITKRRYDYKDVTLGQYSVLLLIAGSYAILTLLLRNIFVIRYFLGIIVCFIYYVKYKKDIVYFVTVKRNKGVK